MMDIRFQNAAVRADVEAAAHARRCLQARMQHRSDRVDHIDVRLGDAAGRGLDRDSYCIVQVKLHGTPAATVVDVGADVYTAIDRAADRGCRLAEEQIRLAGRPQVTGATVLSA